MSQTWFSELAQRAANDLIERARRARARQQRQIADDASSRRGVAIVEAMENRILLSGTSSVTIVETAAPDPFVAGQSVTLDCHPFTDVAPEVATPTGTVEFFNGATDLGPGTLDVSGVATLTTSSLGVEASLTTAYGGDATFESTDVSPPITPTITQDTATVVLNASADPGVYGQATITATVTGDAPGGGLIPTGAVDFFDENTSTVIGAASVDGAGVATLPSPLDVASSADSIVGIYNGDDNYATNSSAPITPIVNQDTTTTSLADSGPTVFGQTMTLTAAVTADAPGSGVATGTVDFFDGATLLGSSMLMGGVAGFPTSGLSVGSHSLTATYEGDSNFTGGTSPVDTATVNTADTTTALTGLPDPSVFGQTKTLTATVTPTAPGRERQPARSSFSTACRSSAPDRSGRRRHTDRFWAGRRIALVDRCL